MTPEEQKLLSLQKGNALLLQVWTSVSDGSAQMRYSLASPEDPPLPVPAPDFRLRAAVWLMSAFDVPEVQALLELLKDTPVPPARDIAWIFSLQVALASLVGLPGVVVPGKDLVWSSGANKHGA